MKKICITLVAAATLFTLSCKKEDNQISNNNKPNSGISEADAKLERSLQNFISKVKNYNTNNAKTRTASNAYSLDSTEFYLETAMNYEYKRVSSEDVKVYSKKISFSIPKNSDGSINFTAIASLYTALKNAAETYGNEVGLIDPHLDLNLEFKEMDLPNYELIADFMLLASYHFDGATMQNPFVIAWHYGAFERLDGYTNPPTGSWTGAYRGIKDATTLLTDYTNWRHRGAVFNGYGIIPTQATPHIYYSNVDSTIITGIHNGGDRTWLKTPSGKSRLWSSITPCQGNITYPVINDHAISAADLNFYYNEVGDLVQAYPKWLQLQTAGFKIMRYKFYANAIIKCATGPGPFVGVPQHNLIIYYGKPHAALQF